MLALNRLKVAGWPGHQRDTEAPDARRMAYWPQSLSVKRSLTTGRLLLYSLNS